MNELEISFEPSPWERFLLTKQMGDTVSAPELLTLLEGEDEGAVEDALAAVETGCMALDISALPVFADSQGAVRLKREAELAKKGLQPELLEPGDPLRLYLEEVAAMPAIRGEAELAAACARGEENARLALTEGGLPRVIAVAAEHTGHGVLLLDLIQEGSLGLWQAAQTYSGGNWASFRDRHIRFAMAKAVLLQARASGLGQKLRTAMEDYRAVDERLLGELGRNPTPAEMAEGLHMTVEETEVVRKTLQNARLLASAKEPPVAEEEEKEAQEQMVEDTAYFRMRQRISELLSGLDAEDARVLTLRFGLEGGLPLSPEDTGRRLGLTPEEVVTKEAAALAKLRK